MNRFGLGVLAIVLLLSNNGCQLEKLKPDPVSAANAILHKHPADFLNQLMALDALASKEAGLATYPWMEILYKASGGLKSKLAATESDSVKVILLNSWVFDSLGLVAVEDSNYLSHSLPSEVIRKKNGSCLGLTLIYLALGQTLELPLSPVLMPGHIFIRYHSNSYTCNIETLRRGLARTDSFYLSNFKLNQRPWYQLKSGTPEQALYALLFNLANHHGSHGDWKHALGEYQLILDALPGHPEALGNQGAGLMAMGENKAAEASFLKSLQGDSLSSAAKENLALINKALGN